MSWLWNTSPRLCRRQRHVHCRIGDDGRRLAVSHEHPSRDERGEDGARLRDAAKMCVPEHIDRASHSHMHHGTPSSRRKVAQPVRATSWWTYNTARSTETHTQRTSEQTSSHNLRQTSTQRHKHLHKHTQSHTPHTPTLQPLIASSPRHSRPPRPRGLRRTPGMPRNRRASCHPPTARPPADAAAPL